MPKTRKTVSTGKTTIKKLGKKNTHKFKTFLKIFCGFLFLLVAGALTYTIITYNSITIPEPDKVALEQRSTVYFSDGVTPISSFADQNRTIIKCDKLPSFVENAIVVSEDRTFWSNFGVDFWGIARAFWNNLTQGTRQGGSTISQQYAERYYMGDNQSYYAKFQEALLAVKLNSSQNKNQILCNYMNTIYFGRNSYGIQAASESYFAKNAWDLSISQAAVLAGLIPSPNNWDPAISKIDAQNRWQRTINLMFEDKYIDKSQADKILKAGLPTTRTDNPNQPFTGTNGYIMQLVQDNIIQEHKISHNNLLSGGYKIVTTINKDKQEAMVEAAKSLPKQASPNAQVGSVAIDNKNGDILALWGGPDNIKHSLNNATQAKAQAGSTFKPFTLLAAANQNLDFNKLYNGNSPVKFKGLKNSVSNAENISYGQINLYKALANSVNTVFVKLNEQVGPQITAENINLAGIDEEIEPTILNVLGFSSVTPLELARAYNTLANSGCRNNPFFIQSISKDNYSIFNAMPSCQQVLTKNDVNKVDQAMQGVIQNGFGQKAKAIGRQIAGKSGTSSDNKSAWFAGYDSNQTAVFGLWQTGQNGQEETISPFGAIPNYAVAGSGWTLDAFVQYMKASK
ncbi:MAG: penicillin-binding protein [Bifidobacteriaceae bacterium]|jgi:membrane peptidoglycan carboxypeptidase|nr:penicillin-binding protein [Bifidobacteriaceae bacterium]